MAILLEETQLKNAALVLGNYPIIAAYLYGSTAIEQATPLSDIDIAVLLAHQNFDPVSTGGR